MENYAFNLSGMPTLVSASWIESVAGGRLNAQRIDARPNARRLPARVYALNIRGGFNPSILVHKGRLLVTMRQRGRMNCIIGEIRGGRVVGARELHDHSGTFQRTGKIFEDLRLFSLRGQVGAVATAWAPGSVSRATIAILGINGSNVVRAHLQHSETHEKNWMPCVTPSGRRARGGLRLVYSTKPLTVLSFKGGRVHPGAPGRMSILRGSSQLIPYAGGYLAVVHQVHVPKIYIHRFVWFNRALTRVRLGTPFFFRRRGVEFCAGLAEHNGKFLLSFGARDSQALIAEVTPAVVQAMVRGGRRGRKQLLV